MSNDYPSARFRSDDCKNGRHEECAASPMIGMCGCECHDYLDELDQQLYGEVSRD